MKYTSKNLKFKVKYETAGSVQIKSVKSIFFSRGELIVDTGEMFLRPESQKDVELLMASSYFDNYGCQIYEGDIIKNQVTKELVVVKNVVGDQFVVYNPECCRYCREEDGCIQPLEDFALSTGEKGFTLEGNIFERYDLIEAQEMKRGHKHGN